MINLGWEPQWLLFKNANATNENWRIYDSMRGWVTDTNDMTLLPNENIAEVTNQNFSSITSTGFNVVTNDAAINTNGHTIIYIAIRRPDGYVGKPVEVGSDVFAINTWITGGDPAIISNFPVDFELDRDPTSGSGWTSDWYARGRLIQSYYLMTNAANSQSSGTWGYYDYNNGWLNRQGHTGYTNWHSWMWKRHAGFDVVTYTGLGGTLVGYAHNLNKIPEMMWVKRRDGTNPWRVYHKGLNGGSSPEGYGIQLNTNAAEASSTTRWGNTAPTSTCFFAGGNTGTNNSGDAYIAILFESVEGISKVGSYSGSNSQQTITTGFQPRFLILKNITNTAQWYVLDTTRGWTSSPADEYFLELDTGDAQAQANFGYPTATGFVLEGGNAVFSASGNNYIYYAHA